MDDGGSSDFFHSRGLRELTEIDFVVHASPTPLLLVSSTGVILSANARIEKLFGYPEGSLPGQLIETLVPKTVRGHHAELREAFMELPTSRWMGTGRDLYGVSKTGVQIPVEIGLDPVEKDGERLVLVSVLDITERVNAERRIRMALDAVSNAVVMIDAQGDIVLANAMAGEMFGYDPSELPGKPIETLLPERYRRRHRVLRKSYITVNRARMMGEGKDLFGLRSDGREIPVEIGLTPIQSSDGILIMSTIMDLTERRRNELETQQRNRELSVLNAELTQFAYSASHDLKAPLASISGLLRLAEEDLEEARLDEVRLNLQKAEGLATSLTERIEALLSIARAEDRLGELTEVDLRELLVETWDRLPEGPLGKPTLRQDLRHQGSVTSSRPMLASVVENLLGNALKFADPEKSHCEVAVSTESVGKFLQLTVSDNGIGIPEERHGEVFKMFRRFAKNGVPGTGLGLALVQKYVHVLGGDIRFESGPEGTTFVVSIPHRPVAVS
ncbi:MAG: PAS domain S-box protein [Myxococcota bacterium]